MKLQYISLALAAKLVSSAGLVDWQNTLSAWGGDISAVNSLVGCDNPLLDIQRALASNNNNPPAEKSCPRQLIGPKYPFVNDKNGQPDHTEYHCGDNVQKTLVTSLYQSNGISSDVNLHDYATGADGINAISLSNTNLNYIRSLKQALFDSNGVTCPATLALYHNCMENYGYTDSTPPQGCTSAPIDKIGNNFINYAHDIRDIVFLLDQSGSITAPKFAIMQDTVKKVAATLCLHPNKTRIALARFSTDTTFAIDLTLEDGDNYAAVEAAIDNMSYTGGWTYMANAFDRIKDEIFVENQGWRNNENGTVTQVFAFTDGAHNGPGNLAASVTALWAEKDPEFYGVGIGGGFVDAELNTIVNAGGNILNVNGIDINDLRKYVFPAWTCYQDWLNALDLNNNRAGWTQCSPFSLSGADKATLNIVDVSAQGKRVHYITDDDTKAICEANGYTYVRDDVYDIIEDELNSVWRVTSAEEACTCDDCHDMTFNHRNAASSTFWSNSTLDDGDYTRTFCCKPGFQFRPDLPEYNYRCNSVNDNNGASMECVTVECEDEFSRESEEQLLAFWTAGRELFANQTTGVYGFNVRKRWKHYDTVFPGVNVTHTEQRQVRGKCCGPCRRSVEYDLNTWDDIVSQNDPCDWSIFKQLKSLGININAHIRGDPIPTLQQTDPQCYEYLDNIIPGDIHNENFLNRPTIRRLCYEAQQLNVNLLETGRILDDVNPYTEAVWGNMDRFYEFEEFTEIVVQDARPGPTWVQLAAGWEHYGDAWERPGKNDHNLFDQVIRRVELNLLTAANRYGMYFDDCDYQIVAIHNILTIEDWQDENTRCWRDSYCFPGNWNFWPLT